MEEFIIGICQCIAELIPFAKGDDGVQVESSIEHALDRSR